VLSQFLLSEFHQIFIAIEMLAACTRLASLGGDFAQSCFNHLCGIYTADQTQRGWLSTSNGLPSLSCGI
jgi:hypothetical protein